MQTILEQSEMLTPPEIRDSDNFNCTQEEAETFYRIIKSYLENFKEKDDSEDFLFAFCSMAFDVCKLPAKEVFVDVSRKKRLVDINLTLDNGVFLSVAKEVGDETDVVMYSVARNNITLDIGEMPIKSVVEKTANALKHIEKTQNYD